LVVTSEQFRLNHIAILFVLFQRTFENPVANLSTIDTDLLGISVRFSAAHLSISTPSTFSTN